MALSEWLQGGDSDSDKTYESSRDYELTRLRLTAYELSYVNESS
jgi:hypothetical protein